MVLSVAFNRLQIQCTPVCGIYSADLLNTIVIAHLALFLIFPPLYIYQLAFSSQLHLMT